ncbi:MAG: YkgJ family cysteine cluster protein [Pirellulales bacterium]|nr:YkgJ family cysteine cluster protein [Pirellulales bacterium]
MSMLSELPVVKPPQFPREKLKPGESLCSHCTAKCCRYFALPIDTPHTYKEFDYLRWYLLHDQATLFTEGKTWYLLVHTSCKHLQADHRCGIYLTRPQICREYTTDDCEYEDHYVYDRYFETAEQIDEYAEAVMGPRSDDQAAKERKQARRGKGKRRQVDHSLRSPQPPLLPVAG